MSFYCKLVGKNNYWCIFKSAIGGEIFFATESKI